MFRPSERRRGASSRAVTRARGAAGAAILTVAILTVLVPVLADDSAQVAFPLHIDVGSSTSYTTADGTTFVADRGFAGGSSTGQESSSGITYRASRVDIAGTEDDPLYRSYRLGMTGYRLPVPGAGAYRVDLHVVELQSGGSGKRVFDVLAEGAVALRGIDIYAQNGRRTAGVHSLDVLVQDGTLDLAFVSNGPLPPAIAAISVSQRTEGAAPASDIPAPPPAAPLERGLPADSVFPTPDTTGPRVAAHEMEVSAGITSTHDGQVIERKDVIGNIRVEHDNVVVRDTRVRFTSTYGLHVRKKTDGSCPVGTLFEYVEVDGQLADEAHVPIYSPGCAWTLDRAHVHNVGRAVKIVNENVVSNSYIVSSRMGPSGSHRGAVGNNGGRNNVLLNNVLLCEGLGCSAAIPMYGDFAPVDGMLVQHNLLATTGSYCAYGGSIAGKRYPEGSNIKFIDNHFSTRYSAKCGRYGPIAGFAGGVRGNEASGNIWHETGEPVPIG